MQATATVRAIETGLRATIPVRDIGSNVSRLPNMCSSCSSREVCLPCCMHSEEAGELDELIYTRIRVKRGQHLFRSGDGFGSLYAIRSGFFKSVSSVEDGREQVTGFHMPGEMLGIDALGTDIHTRDTIALEDSEVCVIPYARLVELGASVEGLQRQFHRILSRQISGEHGIMMLLGTMRAEERLAMFLLNLSQRFLARGYSATEFVLRMTRDEIGSYLGLKLETVSRMFSRFQAEGLVDVSNRHIRILDATGLKGCLGRATH